jgi:hypothetical protein
MRGLFNRLTGTSSSREAAPPPFTLELPDGWAGGYGHEAYMRAMLDYGRAHPECRDQAMDRLRYPPGDDVLFASAAACGPDARMMVAAEDVPDGLPLENALDAYVAGNVEDLASEENLVGQPSATNVDVPHGGRVIHWTWSHEELPPESFALYLLPVGRRLWVLTFSTSQSSFEGHEAAFTGIVSSFRVTLPAPPQGSGAPP